MQHTYSTSRIAHDNWLEEPSPKRYIFCPSNSREWHVGIVLALKFKIRRKCEEDWENKENNKPLNVNHVQDFRRPCNMDLDTQITSQKQQGLDFPSIKRNIKGRFAFLLPDPMSLDNSQRGHRLRPFKSLFPFVKLPHASYAPEGSLLPKQTIEEQINEFFRMPASALYCNANNEDFFGLGMEYQLRKCMDAEVPPLETITGFLGFPNPFKEIVGCDLIAEQALMSELGLNKASDTVKDTSTPKSESTATEELLLIEEEDQGLFGKKWDDIWGDFAKRMEDEWVGHPSLLERFYQKPYLTSGLYFLKGEEKISEDGLKFLLPMADGLLYMDMEKDFELPSDILAFKKLYKEVKVSICLLIYLSV